MNRAGLCVPGSKVGRVSGGILYLDAACDVPHAQHVELALQARFDAGPRQGTLGLET
jgi:hypothetical protein